MTIAPGATMDEEAARWMGRAVTRLEDGNLLRGAGRFIDDIALPGLLHGCFVRSPVAHARLTGIDVAKARGCKGVKAVLIYRDLRPHLTCDRVPLALPVAAIRFHVDPRYLADDELCYVGEPVALVVAESRANRIRSCRAAALPSPRRGHPGRRRPRPSHLSPPTSRDSRPAGQVRSPRRRDSGAIPG